MGFTINHVGAAKSHQQALSSIKVDPALVIKRKQEKEVKEVKRRQDRGEKRVRG